MDFTQTIIVGRVTRPPRLFNDDPNKKPMLAMTVAVNRGSGASKRTTFFEVERRGDDAPALAQYIAAGKEVLVAGSIEVSAFLHGDGKPGASLKLFASTVQLGASGVDAVASATHAAPLASPPAD